MSDTDNFIVDRPLPEALDADQLKTKGISMLQSLVGEVWTNYNDSDPGVTILDQLCYALTELGYCGQFPIEDILTQENGEIHYRDQFFEPQNILTCSPVTTDDYRKLVLDAIPEIRAIYIEAETVDAGGLNQPSCTGRYNSYLSLKSQLSPTRVEQMIHRVYVFLNQHRNLGELFLPPVVLQPRKIGLEGRITLTTSADAEKVRAQILAALRDYAVPMAVQSGYNELLSAGIDPDQIFNGPKLQHGWIAGPAALRGKCQCVSLCNLAILIAGVEGVLSVESLSFVSQESQPESETEISIEKDEVPNITLSSDFWLMRNGVVVTARQNRSKQHYLAALSSIHQAASVSSNVDLYPDLPRGQYRDIEEYYSVQNTFPDIYGIGYNSWQTDAASYRGARSRQLRGYLMGFDQLLANQFSQLAHVGDLFSFRYLPAADERTALSGIPYEKFVTTYYCQPLYNIPDVKPLLLGNNTFHFQYDPLRPEKQVEEEAWKKYREFQFNEYIHGLRQSVESDTEAMVRRDAMLSHLMARHGNDASLYDDMIATCQWFGGTIKTRIIVKNIWMQNFELLSYNRGRAFDFSSSSKLPLPDGLSSTHASEPVYGAGVKGQPWWRGLNYPDIDGEADQMRIYSDARLTMSDFGKFSAFELKLGILLGLPARWRMLAGKLLALLHDPEFEGWLQQPPENQATYSLPDSDISVRRGVGDQDQLFEGEQCLMDIAWPTPASPAAIGEYRAHADQLLWLSTQTKGFLLIESVLLLWGQEPEQLAAGMPYFLNAHLVFPAYVTLIQQPEFFRFINTLVDHHWPAHVELSCVCKPFDSMRAIIASYVQRNNNFNNQQTLWQASRQLAALLQPPVAVSGGA